MTGERGDYRLYGLSVRSALPLQPDRQQLPDAIRLGGDPDVDIVLGDEQDLIMDPPQGCRIAHLELPGAHYTFTRTPDDGFLLRYYGVCDFVISSDLRRVTAQLVRGVDVGLASVLASGSLLSFILVMTRHLVLHSSAVQVGDGALAFVGYSGMGKSTMAALLCAELTPSDAPAGTAGALITDDVLRIDFDGAGQQQPVCRLGATELRLRRSAGSVSERFAGGASVRVTADARNALAPGSAVRDRLPLRAIVIPQPRRDHDQLRLTRMVGGRALITLASYPRIVGWLDPDTQRDQFEQLGRLTTSVPVYRADIPWGPPFDPDLARNLLDQVAEPGRRAETERRVAR
jgi:hypothetical protein